MTYEEAMMLLESGCELSPEELDLIADAFLKERGRKYDPLDGAISLDGSGIIGLED